MLTFNQNFVKYWCDEVWLSCLWERERLWPVGATACFVTWLTHADCCMCVCLLFKTATASDVEILAMDLLWSHSPRHPSLLCFLSVSYNIRPSLLNDGSFHYKRHLTESRPIHQFTLLVCVCVFVCVHCSCPNALKTKLFVWSHFVGTALTYGERCKKWCQSSNSHVQVSFKLKIYTDRCLEVVSVTEVHWNKHYSVLYRRSWPYSQHCNQADKDPELCRAGHSFNL